MIVPICPIDPGHGRLLDWTGERGRDFYCAHSSHAGRPASHPLGASPATPAFFSVEQVDAAQRPKR